jgi:hypothetical protein
MIPATLEILLTQVADEWLATAVGYPGLCGRSSAPLAAIDELLHLVARQASNGKR